MQRYFSKKLNDNKFELNSDEIIEFEVLPNNIVRVVSFNDIENVSYEILICAESVEIIK